MGQSPSQSPFPRVREYGQNKKQKTKKKMLNVALASFLTLLAPPSFSLVKTSSYLVLLRSTSPSIASALQMAAQSLSLLWSCHPPHAALTELIVTAKGTLPYDFDTGDGEAIKTSVVIIAALHELPPV